MIFLSALLLASFLGSLPNINDSDLWIYEAHQTVVAHTEPCHLAMKWRCYSKSSHFGIWVFPKIGVPQNGWFIMEIPIKMDDLGYIFKLCCFPHP